MKQKLQRVVHRGFDSDTLILLDSNSLLLRKRCGGRETDPVDSNGRLERLKQVSPPYKLFDHSFGIREPLSPESQKNRESLFLLGD